MKKSITTNKYDKVTIPELSTQFHLNYYYIISIMYREAQNRLADLKRVDIGQAVDNYTKQCDDLLQRISYYMANRREEMLCKGKEVSVHNSYIASLKQALKELNLLEQDVKSITAHLYCNMAFHPLCSSLHAVISITGAILKELISFEKRLQNSQQAH